MRTGYVGLGLTLILAFPAAGADEPPCPPSSAAAAKTSAPDEPASPDEPKVDPSGLPITIEADDNDFEFDVNGNARLCGNVKMRQGERLVRADCLEYNNVDRSAKLDGAVEYTDPTLKVRGGDGSFSQTAGAEIRGAELVVASSFEQAAAWPGVVTSFVSSL